MGEKHLHYGAIYQVKLFQYSLIWNPLFYQYIRSCTNLFLGLKPIFTELYCGHFVFSEW